MFKYKIKQNNKLNVNSTAGFSLVEMLVSIGIFMSIMTIAISSLISIIGANKKAQAIKNTIDSVTFAVENISRDMRAGTDYKCFTSDGFYSSYCDPEGSNKVEYTSSDGDHTIQYVFENSVLTKIDNNTPVDLISADSNVNIQKMTFYVIGAYCEDSTLEGCNSTKTQPRVIITISGLISVKGSDNTSFNLQTSISQRTRL